MSLLLLYGPSPGVTVSKTQTGVARLTASVTKTQTGVARLSKSLTKTQTGVSRLAITGTKTQSGKARLTQIISKPQSGVARLTKVVASTQPGTARLTGSYSKNQSGKARLSSTFTATQTGKAALAIPVSKLFDDFSSGVFGGQWNSVANYTTSGGTATGSGTNVRYYLFAGRPYDMTDGAISVQIVNYNPGSADRFYPILIQADNGRFTYIKISGGNLIVHCDEYGSSDIVNIPYNSSQHKWFRIRHSTADAATWFETSPDCVAWTRLVGISFGTLTTHGPNAYNGIAVGYQEVLTGNTFSSATIDNVNLYNYSSGQSGRARLSKSVSSITSGVSRLTKSISFTQTGKASLIHNQSLALTGVARLTKVSTKTITGVTRLLHATLLPSYQTTLPPLVLLKAITLTLVKPAATTLTFVEPAAPAVKMTLPPKISLHITLPTQTTVKIVKPTTTTITMVVKPMSSNVYH